VWPRTGAPRFFLWPGGKPCGIWPGGKKVPLGLGARPFGLKPPGPFGGHSGYYSVPPRQEFPGGDFPSFPSPPRVQIPPGPHLGVGPWIQSPWWVEGKRVTLLYSARGALGVTGGTPGQSPRRLNFFPPIVAPGGAKYLPGGSNKGSFRAAGQGAL